MVSLAEGSELQLQTLCSALCVGLHSAGVRPPGSISAGTLQMQGLGGT